MTAADALPDVVTLDRGVDQGTVMIGVATCMRCNVTNYNLRTEAEAQRWLEQHICVGLGR